MWPGNWRRRIEGKLDYLLRKETKFMDAMHQAVADLQAAANALKEDAVANAAQMDTLLADLTAATAANDPSAIEAVTAQLRDLHTSMTATAQRDLPPAPAAAPASPPAP